MHIIHLALTQERLWIYSFLHFKEPYYLYDGCARGVDCGGRGKTCIADNQCTGGCSFAECLQRARSINADGFSFKRESR